MTVTIINFKRACLSYKQVFFWEKLHSDDTVTKFNKKCHTLIQKLTLFNRNLIHTLLILINIIMTQGSRASVLNQSRYYSTNQGCDTLKIVRTQQWQVTKKGKYYIANLRLSV